MSRNKRIDVFRGLAILMVVTLHAGMLLPSPTQMGWGFLLLSRMSTGVQLFFVLSGYLICQSWDRLKVESRPFRIFFLKRISKIVPLYLIFIILQIFIFFFLRNNAIDFLEKQRHFISEKNLTINNIIIHLIFLQGFFPQHIHSLLDGSWSIVCEVYFYIIFPFLLAPVTINLKSAYRVFLIALVVSMYGFLFFTDLYNRFLSSYFGALTDGYSYYFFLTQLPCFVFGVLLFRIDSLKTVIYFFSQSGKIFIVTGVILFFGMLDGNFAPLYYHYFYIFALGLIFLGSRAICFNKGGAAVEFFSMMGRQSYALFLLHIPVLRITSYWLSTTSVVENVYLLFMINLLIGLIVTIVLSTLIFNRIDIYFCRMGDGIMRHWRQTTPTPLFSSTVSGADDDSCK